MSQWGSGGRRFICVKVDSLGARYLHHSAVQTAVRYQLHHPFCNQRRPSNMREGRSQLGGRRKWGLGSGPCNRTLLSAVFPVYLSQSRTETRVGLQSINAHLFLHRVGGKYVLKWHTTECHL